MARPIYVFFDAQAAQHNLNRVRAMAPQSQVMAVVKANAYGHGIVAMARACSAADAFAVASLEEALELRYAGLTHPIVLLEGVFSEDELEKAFAYQLSFVVHCHEQLRMLSKVRLNAPVSVWVKIDSGMHRLGFEPSELMVVYRALMSLTCVQKPLKWMTHFASADDLDSPLTVRQMSRFMSALEGLDHRPIISMANSAAVLQWPDSHGDWVRPGILLYGVSPVSARTGVDLGLKPVMSLMSQVIAIKTVESGETIGYAGIYQVERRMTIAIVAAGYGDGYPRHATVGTPVLVEGKLAPLVGRVSMDMIAVDISHLPSVKVGSTVLCWGSGLPVELIAERAGTIAYELLCGITRRVPTLVASSYL